MKIRDTREDGIWGLGDVVDWIKNVWQFLGYWLQESFKEAAKWGTTIWGLVTILATIVWTVLTHIVPIVSLLLDTLNGLVTGTWNYAPPESIMNVLAIGNTFTPLQEALQLATTYGVLKCSLALFRWLKSLIPTEAGT